MVRSLRQSGIGQLFLGAIVVAIILAFVLTGSAPGGASLTKECAVQVGDHCVEPKEFFAAYGLLTSIGINEQAAKQLRLRDQIARGLAERELLYEQAKKLGLGTSEEDIDDELVDGRARLSLPAEDAERLALSLALCVDGPSGCEPGTIGLRSLRVKRNGEFDYDRYKREVRVVTGRSPNHFKEMQQREYTAERLRQLIRSQAKVSEEEAFLAYSRARGKATARVARLKTGWFSRYTVAPTAEQIEKWKSDHEKELEEATKQLTQTWKEGCNVVSEIRIDSTSASPEEEEDAPEKSAVERIKTIRQKAKSGQDFHLLARQYSDAESAKVGGRIGCLDESYGVGADELINAAKELEKPGDISEVVDTVRGPTLIRLEGRVGAGPGEGDEDQSAESLARQHLAHTLSTEALAEEKARAFAARLIERLQEGEDIAEATDALRREFLEEGPLGAKLAAGEDTLPGAEDEDRPVSDISRPFSIEQSPIADAKPGKNVAAMVFGLEEDDAVVEEPVETATGFAVLQLKEKDLVTRESFEADRTRVMGQLRSRKAEQMLSRYVEDLVKKAGGVKLNQQYVPSGSDEEADPTES